MKHMSDNIWRATFTEEELTANGAKRDPKGSNLLILDEPNGEATIRNIYEQRKGGYKLSSKYSLDTSV